MFPAFLALLTLPVEVLAATKREVPVKFSLTAAQVQRSERVWLKVHGLTFPQQASLRLNGGAYLPLNNATAALEGPGKHYGGIGGPISTHTLSLPVTGLLEGSNTLRFRFNGTDGTSSGFRVIGWNLLDAGGAQVIPASAFKVTDPKYWAAYTVDPGDLADGKHLWETAPITQKNGGVEVSAVTCGGCHARDGRDLKYFGYSNAAIVERWRGHRAGLVGVTQATAEGKKVASYIRRLSVPVLGRPWNPPYQPGPGMDSKPAEAWSAGAGLNAVLARDRDMLPFLFPNGITKEAVSTSKTLNLRELPIAVQLPDWNHWLPRVHPKDAFPAEFAGNEVETWLATIRQHLTEWKAGQRPNYLWDAGSNFSPLANELYAYETRFYPFLAKIQKPYDDPSFTPAHADRIYAAKQWQTVQLWGLMQEFGLEEAARQCFPEKAKVEGRTWLHNTVFNTAPHKLGLLDDGQHSVGGSGRTSVYLNNAWYWLQPILNAGHRQRSGNNPVDWGYGLTHVYGHGNLTPQALRHVAYIVKGMQEADNGKGPDPEFGWHPGWVADPVKMFGNRHDLMWAELSDSERRAVQEAVIGAYLDTARRFTPERYYAAGLAAPSEVPQLNYDGHGRPGDRMRTLLRGMTLSGCSPALRDEIAAWCKTVWPAGDWDTWKDARE